MDRRTKGSAFEATCRDVLQRLGFERTEITKASNDQGADLIGYLDQTKYVFQCKDHRKKQGNKAVQQAIAARTFYKAHRCGVISQSEFTTSAYSLARPNYCLLFMLVELTRVADDGQTFGHLITKYEFPNE